MDLLATYLQDHLALSLGGLRLARRCRDESRGTPLGDALGRLVPRLEDDREALKQVALALGCGRSAVKEAAAALGELAARLLPDGGLLGDRELSRVRELEALLAGTDARRGLWTVLARLARRIPALRPFDLGARAERARGEHAELERLRVRAADAAFAPRRPAGRLATARAAR